MTSPRLVFLGVDAADSRLVRKWAAEGHLPTLARLLESTAVAPITTPRAVIEGGTWPTFLTGSSPATHGMLAFQQIKPDSYYIERGMYADRLPAPPFWTYLSRAGQRVAVVDAPFARPPDALHGIQITNWGSHDSWSWPRSSFPAGLVDEVVTRFGEHPAPYCDAVDRSPADFEDLRARLLAGVGRKTEIIRHFLALEPWDFFFATYSESHCAGHQLWHFMDPSHPRHEPAASPALRSAIRDVYRAIDDGLGAVLGDLSPDAPVLVMLSHGMGPFYAGSHLLDAVLERLGMASPPPGAPPQPDRDSYAITGLRGPLWRLRRLVPRWARELVKARWPAVGEAIWDLTHPAMSLWKPGMRAFVVPSHNMTGAIRINVKGREPVGMVEPGAEYEALCDELIAALSALENPETGRPAVQWVARARDLHRGRRLDDLPDLFVEWEHSAPINALRSERIGTVTGALAETRTGDHWHDGLLMAQGPPFRRGDVAGIRTEDLAPTVLDFLGVPSPSSFEGKSVLRRLTADAAPEPTGTRPSVR